MKKINLEGLGLAKDKKLTRQQLKALTGASNGNGNGIIGICSTKCSNGRYIMLTCPGNCSVNNAKWVGCNGPIYDTIYC